MMPQHTRRGGRPALPEDVRRSVTLAVRLTRAELGALRAHARGQRKGHCVLARELILRALVSDATTSETREARA